MEAIRQAFKDRGLAPRDMIDVQGALWVVHNYKQESNRTMESNLGRNDIEAAMDAFDQFVESEEHAEIFKGFGDPRDYWVRSSRSRKNRVYPTKPIVGFIQRKTKLNGGWGQKHDAAALLHNAGYIIVDTDDVPVFPPERYEHLIRDADRIRLCALNYYIEPARESEATIVSIRAGDLAVAMGINDALPNICQVLGGVKLQEIAGLTAPTHTTPNPSSTTTFTFRLGPEAETDAVSEDSGAKAARPTNLILYGPPGTGKTYQTAWEAVRLCLGEAVAAALHQPDRRKDLMAEYRKLAEAKRIEFVTFHQSMSYEEFVEGLRPSTGEETGQMPDEVGADVGFQLKPHSGIFKRISERAERDLGEGESERRLDRTRRIIRLGLTGENWLEKFNRFISAGEVEWPHGGDTDWSAPEYESWEAIKSERKKDDPSVLGSQPAIYGTWLFRADAEVGDYVALTVGTKRVVALGRLEGDYTYEAATDTGAARHTRSVKWIWNSAEGVERDGIYDSNFTAFHTAYPLLEEQLHWDGVDRLVYGSDLSTQSTNARPYVLIIDDNEYRRSFDCSSRYSIA